MTEKSSGIDFQLPVVANIARAIKENPGKAIKIEFGDQDLNVVMTQFVSAALVKVPGLQLNPQLNTQIKDQKGAIFGQIQAIHAATGISTVGLNLLLGNNMDGKTLSVLRRDVDTSNLGIRANVAAGLAGIDINQTINNTFLNLNFLIFSGFRDQLKFQGVNLQNMEATFVPGDKIRFVFIS